MPRRVEVSLLRYLEACSTARALKQAQDTGLLIFQQCRNPFRWLLLFEDPLCCLAVPSSAWQRWMGCSAIAGASPLRWNDRSVPGSAQPGFFGTHHTRGCVFSNPSKWKEHLSLCSKAVLSQEFGTLLWKGLFQSLPCPILIGGLFLQRYCDRLRS